MYKALKDNHNQNVSDKIECKFEKQCSKMVKDNMRSNKKYEELKAKHRIRHDKKDEYMEK